MLVSVAYPCSLWKKRRSDILKEERERILFAPFSIKRKVSVLYLRMEQPYLSLKQDLTVQDGNGKVRYRVESQPLKYSRYLTIYDAETGQEKAVLKDIVSRAFEMEMGLFIDDEHILSVKQSRINKLISYPFTISGKDWSFDHSKDEEQYSLISHTGETLVRVDQQSDIFIDNILLDPIEVLGIVLAEKMIEERVNK